MQFAVLGTGVVGKTIAAKLVALGHDVALGTRDPAATRARTAPGAYGDGPLSDWLTANPAVRLATFAEAARDGEIVVNATSGQATLAALEAAGADHLAGKVLLDLSNPLDFSAGMPPRLFVCNDDSLGEQIQRAFPAARVVKTLNTVNAHLMVDPGQLRDGHHTMFLSGDDASAKATARELLGAFGWTDVIDLGGISTARGTEMVLALWTRVWVATKNPMFAFAVVR